MSNKEYSRLAFLMDSFGVSGQELANYLHLDKTLVSKWRNQKRPLSARSEYIESISAYFVKRDALMNNATIKKILGHTGNADSTQDNYPELLSDWLKGKEVTSEKYDNAPCGTLPGGFELFQGNEGKREAVLRFFDHALTLPQGQRLLLVSQEDQSWLTEDREFLKIWKEKMSAILSGNNHITVIHTVDRSFKDLAPILTQWLPLHMTGKITSYYYPKYQDNMARVTLFIIKGQLAVTGITSSGFTRGIYTHYYTHPAVVKECEWHYDALVSQCQGLLDNYTKTPLAKLHQAIAAASQKPENSYVIASCPFLRTMPQELLQSVLAENGISGYIDKYLGQFKQADLYLQSISRQYHVRHIYDLDVLTDAAANGIVYQGGLLPAGISKLMISGGQFRQQLIHLAELLETYPNFEVALSSGILGMDFRGIYMSTGEYTLFYAGGIINHSQESHPVSIAEPTLVNAYYQFIDNIWQSIPRVYRSKEWVISKLMEIAGNYPEISSKETAGN